ncbi:unknown [Prevotella sp. CAG:604]|nr:unknown [Prevotella sp. CAG:604]
MLEKREWFFDLNQKRKVFGNFFNKLFAGTVESSYLCIVKKKKTKKLG